MSTSVKWDDQWQVFMNDDDVPRNCGCLPSTDACWQRDAADREVRNYVKERFTAARCN